MLDRIKKHLTEARRISFILIMVGMLTLPCHAESGSDVFFSYLDAFAEAIYLYESGQLKQAIEKLDKLTVKIDNAGAKSRHVANAPLLRPNTKCGDSLKQLRAEVLELKGLAQFGIEQRAPAVASLRKATALCPEHGAIHGSLGSVLVRTKKIKDGVIELNRAIKLDTTNRDAVIMRAQGLDLLGKSREAKADVARASKLTTDQQKKIDSLTEKIDSLYREKNIKEALLLDEQLLRLAPRDSLVLTGYAEHLMASSRYSEAMRYVSCAINLDPSSAYALRIRSAINSFLQKPDLELSDAKKALSTEPRSLEALNSRALALLDNDKPLQAVDDYNLVLKRKTDFVDGYINRSTAYLRLGDTAHSIKDAKMAISLASSSAYGYQNLGAALRRAGMLDEARKTLEQSFRYSAQASADSLAMAHFNLGAVLLSLKKKSEAQPHLDKALSLAPGLPRILLMRSAYDASPSIVDETSRQLKRPLSRMNTPNMSKLHGRPTPKASAQPRKTATTQKTVSKVRARIIRQSIPDLEDALLAANTALATKTQDASLYETRATIYVCKGQFADAANDFKKSAEILNCSGDVAQRALINYFLCQERLKKTEEAKSVLQAHLPPDVASASSTKSLNPASTSATHSTFSTAAIPTEGPPSNLNRLLTRYLLNEINEDDLLKNKTSKGDLTTIHAVCAMHLTNRGEIEKSKPHWQWVLNTSDSNSTALVIAATELPRLSRDERRSAK